jgi:hypothetical protein
MEVEAAVLAGLEPATLRIYGTSLKCFAGFCSEKAIPESQRVPVSELLICSFATVMALRKVARMTLNS